MVRIPSVQLSCPICYGLAKENRKCNHCSAYYCYDCIDGLYRKKKWSYLDTFDCYVCHGELSLPLLHDAKIEQYIEQQVEKPCKFCFKRVFVRKMEDHWCLECPKSSGVFSCPLRRFGCGFKSDLLEERQNHYANECIYYPLKEVLEHQDKVNKGLRIRNRNLTILNQRMKETAIESEQKIQTLTAELRREIQRKQGSGRKNHRFMGLWNKKAKYKGLRISNMGKTVDSFPKGESSIGEKLYRTCLAQASPFSSGIHSWILHIDQTDPQNGDLVIGVCHPNHPIDIGCGFTGNSWGIRASDFCKLHKGVAKRIDSEPPLTSLESGSDVVFVVDLKLGILKIGVNGIDFGEIFINVKPPIVPCVSGFGSFMITIV